MRKCLGLTGLLLLALSGAVGLGLAKTPSTAVIPSSPQLAASGLVVHEWGTFTSFSGSDGARLEFRPLVDDELPGFVHNRVRQGGGLDLLASKVDISALERMETPVTYFYVDRPLDVEVKVAFPQGLLTEFYPPVQTMLPAFQRGKRPAIADSLLDWGRVRLLPPAVFERLPLALPEVVGDNHYAFARETDSAIVEVVDQYLQKHYEKFLFYRGLGDFSLPLAFSASASGRYLVENDGPEAVEHLFLMHIDGSMVRFQHAPEVAAGGSLGMELPERESTIEQLGEEMVHALTETGLYEKEARAMVKTWHSSWFGEPGTRLLYLVPERITDELLPLDVQPQPDELVRVLVGRMEILAPAEAERLLKLVRESGDCLAIEAEPLRSELTRLGRFAEPALRYLAGCAKEKRERATIERLAAALSVTMHGQLPEVIERPARENSGLAND